MTIKVRTASGATGVNSIRIRAATGTLRAARIKFRTGLGAGDLDQVYTGVDSLSVSFSDGNFVTFNNATVSGSITATVAGGLGPFTYSWSVLTFSSASTPTFISPTSATTTVRQISVPPENFETATLQVVVNDAAGQTITATVPVTFNHVTFS